MSGNVIDSEKNNGSLFSSRQPNNSQVYYQGHKIPEYVSSNLR